MELPAPKTVVQRYGGNVRLQFWLLCVIVVILIIVYGTVFWDSLSQPHTPHSGYYKYRRWEDEYPAEHDGKAKQASFDLHVENEGHEEAADGSHFLSHQHGGSGRKPKSVAIGCAITSRDHSDLSLDNLQFRLPFLRTLLPSFCHTASYGFDYHFYVAFDVGDPNLNQPVVLSTFNRYFEEARATHCPPGANVSLHFIQCRHNHNPAWAQNDAMMEAYLDDMEYFYRVNDDTHMLSPGWTETFIEALHSFQPPKVGVAGPVHKGGNEFILTYDFVHRTHVDIFGYYYPRLFTDWWADDWITSVYGEERTVKLPSVRLKHTQEAGQRYRVQYNNEELVHYQVTHDRRTLQRFLASKAQPANTTSVTGKRVVSMSLWGSDPRYTFGAIRNAQLMPIFFPSWSLRVYIEKPVFSPRYDPVPGRVVGALRTLGAEIAHVDTTEVAIKPMLWRFLIADDMSVDCFIVRDSDSRLSDRDAAIVEDWLKSGSPFHCVRDHPSHSQYSISGGLWGAKPRDLLEIIPIPWKNLMMGYSGRYGMDMAFLANAIWPKVMAHSYCHDSFSCGRWTGAHPFPVLRTGAEHVGQVFDAFGYARDEDMKIVREAAPVPECTTPNATLPGPPELRYKAKALDPGVLGRLEDSMETRNKQNQMKNALKEELGEKPDAGNDEEQQKLPAKVIDGDTLSDKMFLESQRESGNLSQSLEGSKQRRDTVKPTPDLPNHAEGVLKESVPGQESKGRDWDNNRGVRTRSKTYAESPLGSIFGGKNTPKERVNVKSGSLPMNISTNAKTPSLDGSNKTVIVWSMDFDINPVRDIKHLVRNQTRIHFLDKSLSSRCQATKTCATNLRVITRRSVFAMTPELMKQFWEEYADDPEMNLVTHFLCTSPVATCELYIPFGKAIVVYITRRYEEARYTQEAWQVWNARLIGLSKDPKSVIAASNHYDAQYVKHFTGIAPTVLPPVCSYVTSSYNPTLPQILISPIQSPEFQDMFLTLLARLKSPSTVAMINDLYPSPQPSNLAAHPAVIYIPCQVASYDFCEQYYANIPLFVPSVDLLARWHHKFGVISQLTLNSVRRLMGNQHNGSLVPAADSDPDPNDGTSLASLQHWLQYAEVYHMPHVVIFDSVSDLVAKLSGTDLSQVSFNMKKFNQGRDQSMGIKWATLLGTDVINHS